MTEAITITTPDDWHIHLRDGHSLTRTVKDAANQFQRAIIMPNLVPPVLNAQQALAYKERILQRVPEGSTFEPLMVLYLTDKTTPDDIIAAKKVGVVACKLYPAGATTNSDSGVTDIFKLTATIEAMAEQGLLLLIHGEVTDADIDIFDREATFIEQILKPLVAQIPNIRIVLEHITTADAVNFVTQAGTNIAATITAHHLLFNRNHMLVGGIKPHYYCLPILKRQQHQKALMAAATSGSPKFFLGTDSAPHAQHKKETSCGCAGSYTAYSAMELYAEAFDNANALDKLEAFASYYGPDFYGLPRNTSTITLSKQSWTLPESLDLDEAPLIPLCAGEVIHWQLSSSINKP